MVNLVSWTRGDEPTTKKTTGRADFGSIACEDNSDDVRSEGSSSSITRGGHCHRLRYSQETRHIPDTATLDRLLILISQLRSRDCNLKLNQVCVYLEEQILYVTINLPFVILYRQIHCTVNSFYL